MNNLLHLAAHGFSATDSALALVRIGTGAFFAISGFNKLFDPGRHAALTRNLTKNGIPAIPIMKWWVPGWEFLSGAWLALGFFTAFNAGVLAIICIVACCCEAKAKVEAFRPINAGDRIADYLYLPEVLYLLLLSVSVLAGSGIYSIDAILFR